MSSKRKPIPVTRAPSTARTPVHSPPKAVVQATVSRKTKEGRTEVLRDDEVRSYVEELANAPHVARVRVSGGITKNMGEFEFIRVDVSVDMPCLPDLDGDFGILATKQFCSTKVDEFVAEEVSLATR